MFEQSSIFLLIEEKHTLKIFRIEMDDDTQSSICNDFSNLTSKLIDEKEAIVFDGCYKPDDDECLKIENFPLYDEIKDAVRNPLGVSSFQIPEDGFPDIKAIFVGERKQTSNNESFCISFQRFRKEQYLLPKNYHLFFTGNTFCRESKFGISVIDCIDCCYHNNTLWFSSFYYTRQIFDLSNYYRSATDPEVETFCTHPAIYVEDIEAFKKNATTTVRRKIAFINDSNVLDRFAIHDVVSKANNVGINITLNDNRIIIPSDKKQIKLILGFLDDATYKGTFSDNVYFANSKRPISDT